MNCRYCGSEYAKDAMVCGGCGARKGGLGQKLLDVPATPEHWSNTFGGMTVRVFLITFAAVLLMTLADRAGLGEPAGVIGFFWAVPVVPSLLAWAAWRETKGAWGAFLGRLFIAIGIAGLIAVTILFTIGMMEAFRQPVAAPETVVAPNAPLQVE